MDNHLNNCAMRMHSASECTCGKADHDAKKLKLQRCAPMPSIKTLEDIHDADHAAMRKILLMSRAELLATDIGQEFGRNFETEQIRMHCLDAAARTYGTETMRAKNGEFAEYLNTGDTYAPTIIYWRGRYRVQDVGTFVETMERNGIKFE